MSPNELTAFRVEPAVMEGLRAIKAKEGLPISVQVDFALKAWLKKKAPKKKTTKRRAPTGQ